ncbi:MAG: EcsC family protein [Micrococcaceae bacterium]
MKKQNKKANGIEESLNQSAKVMLKTLDWTYDRALAGIPGIDSKDIHELVKHHSQYSNDKEVVIDRIVKAQITKAGTSGFVTGFGGLITLPATIPANIATNIYNQLRMILAIAAIRGYDPHSEEVRTFAYVALTGSSLADVLKKSSVELARKLTTKQIGKIPGKVLMKINKAVGFHLVAKSSSKGLINLGKMVPVVGAVVGGSIDTLATRTIARKAKETFTDKGIALGGEHIISIEEVGPDAEDK